VPGSSDKILKTLESYNLLWDGEVGYQSKNYDDYQDALANLRKNSFQCACTRKILQPNQPYPGTCRNLNLESDSYSTRVISKRNPIKFNDLIQGECNFNLGIDSGDFVVKRADGIFSYHLANVVDDIKLRVNTVVRGADLLRETPKQIHLYNLLGEVPPKYGHIPIATNSQGQKLSKQNLSPEIAREKNEIKRNLMLALGFLGQTPPSIDMEITEILEYAIKHWDINKVPNKAIALDEFNVAKRKNR
jgi:glutamyl-Q tRNA(Asp) synthetase